MFNRRYIYLLVVLVTLAVSFFSLTNKGSVSKLLASANDQPGVGASVVFLPVISKPMIINTMADGTDWDPGDGFCETGPGNNICTLRAIIQETNAQVGPDTIFVPAGQYKLTIVGAGENNGASGDLDVLDDLTIIGANAAMTIIDGNQTDRVFDVRDSTVSISYVTIKNGDVSGSSEGGGIINGEGPLTLDQVVIDNNMAQSGGGIESFGPLTVTNSIISNNEAVYGNGGGIKAGTLSIFGTTVQGNIAERIGGGINAMWIVLADSIIINNTIGSAGPVREGGGLSISIFATLDNCTIANNMVSNGVGGGIFITTNATVTINRCHIIGNAVTGSSSGVGGGGIYSESHQVVAITDTTIQGNSSGYSGGGIHHVPGFSPVGEMRLNRVTVRQNTAPAFGAGIYNDWKMYLTNVTISGNEAVGSFNQYGGGIYQHGLLLMITNSTIAENKARNGGGIYQSSGDIFLENTILADNLISLGGNTSTYNCSGSFTSNGHNLEDGDNCNFNAVGDLSNTDPLLAPLLTGYGWTAFYPLNNGSPAIDKGNNSVCPAIDQRGAVRPFDGDGNGSAICDIGSFEYP